MEASTGIYSQSASFRDRYRSDAPGPLGCVDLLERYPPQLIFAFCIFTLQARRPFSVGLIHTYFPFAFGFSFTRLSDIRSL